MRRWISRRAAIRWSGVRTAYSGPLPCTTPSPPTASAANNPPLAAHLADRVDDVFDDADTIVVATEWTHYRDLDWAKFAPTMRSPLVLDGRHCLDADRLTEFGYRYLTMNSPALPPRRQP